ncbi:MAG: Maf and M48 domain-containing protein [Candidatus Omnitrophota bacterium]|nr:Maf and M48 domain-containing protein [Candidatus Omnitrophota bacterium]
MKRIYLASDSRARKKLLKEFGLKFKVMPSRFSEGEKPAGASYAEYVKRNALKKAKGVAGKIKGGIIVAADTILVQDKKIFGKPEDLEAAKRMLKKISRKPQWLYTGIAVIDKDRGKVLLDYEKTKVYMDPLNDKQIADYFSTVSPLDKAGSFDIRGRGAIFIRRIEGCFYNVVGLPLRKLYIMLKKIDIKLPLFTLTTIYYLLSTVFLGGCTTEYNIATGEEDTIYYVYSTDKEVQMGKNIARQVAEEYKFVEDPLIQKRVEDIGKKIAAVCDRKEIDYHFQVIEDKEVNAFSLPGGYVYLNSGLVEKVKNDDELAGVLAHEVAHIVARHAIKKLQASQLYTLARVLVAQAPSSGEVGAAADEAFTQIMLGYSREDEFLADQLGARYAKRAGYDPYGMISFLETLEEVNKRKPLRSPMYYKTHPYVPDRVRVVKQELGEQITFSDYINIEYTPHK